VPSIPELLSYNYLYYNKLVHISLLMDEGWEGSAKKIFAH